MPGTQIFTYANVGKETVRGTPVAPTRKLYVEGTGVLDVDPSLSTHEAENRGRRIRINRATQKAEDVTLAMRYADGVGYDDLVVPFSQLKGGVSAVGAGADKTWTFTPSLTAANSPEAYSIDVGDDTQNWRCQYGMLSEFTIGAAVGDLTTLDMSWFAQRAVKGAKASPADNAAVKIPGDLWTVKFAATFAGLAGASISTNFLLDWSWQIRTGLLPRHYLDGNLYFGQHVETDIAGTLTMHVESTALAVSEFYDKWLAQTMDFIRLKATGPSLGGSAYSAQIDTPVIYTKVKPISAEQDGVNIYEITASLADDGTNGIAPVLVNSMTALP